MKHVVDNSAPMDDLLAVVPDVLNLLLVSQLLLHLENAFGHSRACAPHHPHCCLLLPREYVHESPN